MQSKTMCHCFECGYHGEVIHVDPKVVSYGKFLEHTIPGTNVRCLPSGTNVMKYSKSIGSNSDFTLHLVTVHRS